VLGRRLNKDGERTDEQIESLEYLPTEQVPSLPLFRNTIDDVRCQKGHAVNLLDCSCVLKKPRLHLIEDPSAGRFPGAGKIKSSAVEKPCRWK
jgi:hypothetical protein